jgi:putative endonuclease
MTPHPPSPKRRAAEIRGRYAEDAVAARWEADGYHILARRLRTQSGEIDLVAANAEKLVFIEVKARKSFADAAYAVLPRQQSRLLDAAGAALALHESWHRPEIRFDVALVCNGAIQTIEDAIRYN